MKSFGHGLFCFLFPRKGGDVEAVYIYYVLIYVCITYSYMYTKFVTIFLRLTFSKSDCQDFLLC